MNQNTEMLAEQKEAVRAFLKKHFKERCTSTGAVYQTSEFQSDWMLNLIQDQITQATEPLKAEIEMWRDRFQNRENAIAQLESENAALVEALEEIRQYLKAHVGHVNQEGYAWLIADKALMNLSTQSQARDARLREAVIDEAKTKIESIRREVYTTRNMMGSEEWKLQEAYILACNDIVEALTQLKGGE